MTSKRFGYFHGRIMISMMNNRKILKSISEYTGIEIDKLRDYMLANDPGNITFRDLLLLSGALGVDVNWLVFGSNEDDCDSQ